MKKKNQTIDALINEFCDYLKKIRRSEATIRLYCAKWKRVKDFMTSHKIKFYDKTVEEKFLSSVLGNYDYSQLSQYNINLVNRIEALAEFQDTGTILNGMRRKPARTFEGPIGATMTNYMDYKQSIFGLSRIIPA
jgi:hypothetical protein